MKLHLQTGLALLALFFSLLLLLPEKASAVSITGSQVTPTEWAYDLTFAPLDNYSIFQQFTTITLTGLFGVTGATGPTSTDFSPAGGFIDTINLTWSAQVLGSGTAVQWIHDGPGTGNFGIEKHIFGFRVFASGAEDGLVSLTTDGFSRDTTNPLPSGAFSVDITSVVAGPVAPVTTVPEPSTVLIMAVGCLGLFAYRRWCRQP